MESDAIIALAALLVSVVGALSWMPFGKALIERLRGPARSAEAVLEELRELRREVGELSERVDFTERLLAKQREPGGLAPPR